MKIVHTASELQPGRQKICAAIGVFDGVHLGHQQVIRQTLADARQEEALAVAITFDCHPSAVVAPERVPPLIYSLPQKLRAIAGLGVDATLLIHFDETFSRTSAETFIQDLACEPGQIHSLCVGAAFTFGHQRRGNVALLEKLGGELNFQVHGLAAVSLDGQIVSSTRIREAIVAGGFDLASQMLGRPYALAGTVIRGDRVGRRLGFPTANVDTEHLALPPNGVYAAHVVVIGDKVYRAAVNIGHRPTLKSAGARLLVEAHLLDFEGDLYDRELEINFLEKLREERKFASPLELRVQIARDIEAARAVF